MEVGDKVLVMPALGENMAVPLGSADIGDSVILYSLKDETRIAVPTLGFSIGSYAFNTPAFNFSGFNFNLDFNFQLISLILGFYGDFTDHDLKISIDGGAFVYGDTASFTKYTSGTQYGEVEYSLTLDVTPPETGPQNDVSICLTNKGTSLEIWICAGREYDYGAGSYMALYLFDVLVWYGDLRPAMYHPGYILYHNESWTT